MSRLPLSPRLFVCDGALLPADWLTREWQGRAYLNHLGANAPLTLRLDRSPRRLVDTLHGHALDLLRIATYVYAADQMVSRGGDADVFGDRWQRHMALAIPVTDPAFWSERTVLEQLSGTLGFLSDDQWEFAFSRAPTESERPPLLDQRESSGEPDMVVLFSGGADSLCAAVEAILLQGRRPILVSHQSNPVVQSRQATLVEAVHRASAAWRVPHLSLLVNRPGSGAAETSQRTRAFLFAALGTVVAHGLGISDVLLSDNGVVSINLPFTFGQFGAQATRSTHPRFIADFNALAQLALGTASISVCNSLWSRTRPEVLRTLQNTGTERLLSLTTSCAHPRGRSARQRHCGVCSQCVDRRFGVLAAGLELYDPADGYDIDVFRDNIPEGKARKLAVGYYNLGLRLHETAEGAAFLTQFQRLWDCVPYTEGSPDQAVEVLTRMLKRHGTAVVRVMEAQIARVNDLIARRRLPQYSLPALMRGIAAVPSMATRPERAAFRRVGEMYAITFDGKSVHLKQRDGLVYLHELLAHPGREFPAEDLHRRLGSRTVDTLMPHAANLNEAQSAGLRPTNLASQQAGADDQALADYRSRLREIAEERESALAANDLTRLARLEDAEAHLSAELRRASALGRKSRAIMDPMKKPRQAVQQAIKLARRQIELQHPSLGRFLRNRIKTGNVCWYEPDETIDWIV